MEGEWGSEEAREMDGLRPGSLAGLLLLCQGEALERFDRTISSLLGCKMGWLLQAFSHIRSFILSCCSYLSKIFFCIILNMLHIWVLRESIFGENICEARPTFSSAVHLQCIVQLLEGNAAYWTELQHPTLLKLSKPTLSPSAPTPTSPTAPPFPSGWRSISVKGWQLIYSGWSQQGGTLPPTPPPQSQLIPNWSTVSTGATLRLQLITPFFWSKLTWANIIHRARAALVCYQRSCARANTALENHSRQSQWWSGRTFEEVNILVKSVKNRKIHTNQSLRSIN